MIGKKGSAEVVSFLRHFIFNLLKSGVRHLEIFYGQNKNYYIFRYLHYVLVTETPMFDTIKMTFPIRGHSYLECNRDMALVNQKCRA
ncbi:hypothetical protein C0J52_08327 [Blattella germanica]|nr:hypothetical protein C0J52_08327 [Blattella germanica]